MRQVIREFSPESAIDLVNILKYSRWRLPVRQEYIPLVKGKHGIEIGGPSALFETMLPLYEHVGSLDGVNFGGDTIWEGHIEAGANFVYGNGRRGRQFIAEAADLGLISSGHYDFLLSSNCLEHVANVIKALMEWRRVIKAGGTLVLILPNKESNFDHNRPVTRFEHLLEDYAQDVGEDDLTHLDEILALHDLPMDPPAGSFEQFRERSLKNFENRTLHHHIFDNGLVEKVLDHCGFEVIDLTATRNDFFALATKKSDAGFSLE